MFPGVRCSLPGCCKPPLLAGGARPVSSGPSEIPLLTALLQVQALGVPTASRKSSTATRSPHADFGEASADMPEAVDASVWVGGDPSQWLQSVLEGLLAESQLVDSY